MKIRNSIKKSVIFIGLQMADGSYRFVGTGLFFFDHTQLERHTYLGTAKHVIEGIKSTGLDTVYIRVNLKNRLSQWFNTSIDKWIYADDPNVDIAIHSCGILDDWDHEFFSLGLAMTEKVIQEHEIEVGEEVFVVGLFKHHHGTSKNIPIVRVGNISALPEEKIQTKEYLMDAYLIEARSIGGLSGSPVFVNLGTIRIIKEKIVHRTKELHFIMGLITGHYDSKTKEIDSADNKENERVNTGIAIVTPVDKLIELFNSDKIIEFEKTLK